MSQVDLLDELRALVRKDGRFAIEAYLFLYQALERAQANVGSPRHVNGKELLEGFRQLVCESFGPLAPMVLGQWRLTSTEDVGAMVFNLVETGLMGKTDEDCLEDFSGAYSFEEAFDPQLLLSLVDPQELVPAYRVVARELPGAGRVRVSSQQN